ncbi:MAG: hypothetical protein HKUEN01_03560 [Candidatus Kuenenia stuttgartiensis]|uniref:Uncharacterized protein n=1 Tax=Kuenenia stuttgartiensis TaxID=174633 RepID=A0A2C9CB75_KUEST|nr:hypothetical protein [Candidatus Kuenenia stuttgartiensis]GJQ47970.1 MAG: hypothetical protein HKUEN01_03560 [Candidatus Kuenenia stuttgartiensis]SOH02950.1 hypothetical protein KSMBR1_0436 [Candidatus Kuenenia stuttgartiensis]
MVEFLVEHKTWLLIGSFIIALLLPALQHLSNIVSEHKAQKDQEKLMQENKALQKQVEVLSTQNVELSKQVSILDSKAEIIKGIGQNQLFATFYTEELSQNISSMWLKIMLKEEMEYAKLLPLAFAIEISFDKYNSNTTRFYITDAGTMANSKGKSTPVSSYRVVSGALKRKEDKIYSEMFAPSQKSLNEIVVPITIFEQDKMTIKQFQDYSIIFFLPDAIIDIATNLEFIINGWAILDQSINSAVWVRNPAKYSWYHVGNIENLKRSATNDPSVAPAFSLWPLNLFQGIPKKYSGFPGSVRPIFHVTHAEIKSEQDIQPDRVESGHVEK